MEDLRRAIPLTTLPPDLRAALEAAAILDRFAAAGLAALLGLPAGASPARLLTDGLVRVEEEEKLRVAPDLRADVMEQLEQDPERLRELRGRAARYYAEQLAAGPDSGRAEMEEIYIGHLERHCEALIQQQPTLLAGEVSAAPIDLLRQPRNRHLVWYYRGLGEGLQDRFESARAAFDRLLAERDLDDTIRGRVLNSRARFAQLQGEYEQALNGYRESYTIWQRLGNLTRQGIALNNRGILHYELQNYPAAEADFRESARLFAVTGATYHQARAYNELGLLFRDQGHWAEARAHLAMAAELFRREGATDFLGRSSANIGEVELLAGNFDVAIEHFEQSLSQMTTRVYAVDVHLHRGLVHQAQDDHVGALAHYREALRLAIELGRRDVVALIHYRIGHAEEHLGVLETAQASYVAAIEEIETTRAPLRDEDLMISLMGRWQQVYEALVQLCLRRGDVVGAFDYAERARARAFADVLMRRSAGEAPASAETHARPVTAAEVQAALPADALLLAYFTTGLRGLESMMLDALPREAAGLRACLITPPRTLLFAVKAAELRAHDCKLDPNAFRSPHLQDGRRFLAPHLLRRAFAGLIGPAVDLVRRSSAIMVVPHGPLHQMPFAAFVDHETDATIDSALPLVHAPSATLLLRALGRQRDPAPLPCLAVGFDGGPERDLRHTEREALSVAAICGGVGRRGEPGICRELQVVASQYRWLHLACHGEFDLDDPLRSWLELGPGERLSAAEVLQQWNLNAELVTLSACRSGISRVLRGDEPMGLVRAFLSAGAQAVLVTLWPVEDTSARILMERFYATLIDQGRVFDPAAALRDAQGYLRTLTASAVRDWLNSRDGDLSVLERADETGQPYADPIFWAPYALIGGASRTFGDRR